MVFRGFAIVTEMWVMLAGMRGRLRYRNDIWHNQERVLGIHGI